MEPDKSSLQQQPNPGFLKLLKCKCPRCRQGDMFVHPNPYKLKTTMKMHDNCPVCGQHFDLEVGFYYGASYVSYGFAVAISVATFIAWWVLIGLSVSDNRIFYWLVFNGIFLVALQPYLMRLSRTFWLVFFVKYDKDWRIHDVEKPERVNEDLKNAW